MTSAAVYRDVTFIKVNIIEYIGNVSFVLFHLDK